MKPCHVPRVAVLSLAVAASLALGACNRNEAGPPPPAAADTTGGSPARPAGGDTVPLAQPQAPDSPPGGPSGVKGSMAHPGASGGDVMPGTSGKGIADAGASGTQEMGHRSQPAQAGVGLNGGLSKTLPYGATTSSTQEGVAPRGTTNRTSSP